MLLSPGIGFPNDTIFSEISGTPILFSGAVYCVFTVNGGVTLLNLMDTSLNLLASVHPQGAVQLKLQKIFWFEYQEQCIHICF